MHNYHVSEIVEYLTDKLGDCRVMRSTDSAIKTASSINRISEYSIIFLTKQRWNTSKPEFANVSCIITDDASLSDIEDYEGCFSILVVANPRLAFVLILERFFADLSLNCIHPSAQIEDGAIIGNNVSVGAFCCISKDSEIGDGTVISSGCALEGPIKIGSNCYIGAGTKIGHIGFGFEKTLDGKKIRMPHIGSVLIGNDVHIGSNTVIDRGTLDQTVISDGVYINNLCHIAHNVIIEKDCVINANVTICGSVSIGSNSWIAPSSIFRDKTSITQETKIGAGTVVTKPLSQSDTYVGNPARPLSKYVNALRFIDKNDGSHE